MSAMIDGQVLIALRDVGKAYPIANTPASRFKTLAALLMRRGFPESFHALSGINLEVRRGESLGLIGANGAGKSTFLNAISGDQSVDKGRIAIDGFDVTRQPVWARSQRVARVFQDPMAGTCEDLTIEENMALAQQRGTRRGLHGAVKQAERAMYRERLATLGLGLENRLPTASACSRAASARP